MYGYMLYDKRENLLPSPHGLLFLISDLIYAPFHTQDSTYHCLWYISCEALAGTRNRSMDPSYGIDLTIHCTMSGCSYHRATSRSYLEAFKCWLASIICTVFKLGMSITEMPILKHGVVIFVIFIFLTIS